MKQYTTMDLRRELAKFEQELIANDYADASVHTYVDRAGRFVSWLDGDFKPTKQG